MATLNSFIKYTIDNAGGTIDLDSPIQAIPNGLGTEQLVFITGTATLAGSQVFTCTGTLTEGARFVIVYNGVVDLNGNNLTIFGVQLTQQQANSKCLIVVDYDGSSFITNIQPSQDNIGDYITGVEVITLDANGGTITLDPKINAKVQYVTGTATLVASWNITGNGASTNHGFWIFYDGALTMGLNNVTIFSQQLTANEALNGNVSVYAEYDVANTTYYSQKISGQAGDANINQYLQLYLDEVNGNDGTAIAGRLDRPFATVAAVNTAAVAYSPTSTTRPNVNLIGTTTQQIVLKDNVDYDISKATLTLATGNGAATITDNGADVNSIVRGWGNIVRSGTGTTPVGCIYITGTNSDVTVYANKLESSTGGANDFVAGNTGGKLTVYFNELVASNTNGAFYSTGGELYFEGRKATTAKAFAAGTAGTQKGYVDYIECTEATSTSIDVFGCNGALNQYITFKDLLYQNPNSEVVRYNSSGNIIIECLGTVQCDEQILKTDSSATGICEIKGGNWLTSSILAANIANTAAIYYLHDMSIKATGTDADIISVAGATSVQKIKNIIAETNGTGEFLTSGVAVDVLNYGGCACNLASNVNVTEEVDASVIDVDVRVDI